MKKFIILLLLGLLVSACAKKVAPPPAIDSLPWEDMQTLSRDADGKPYRIQLSLRFGVEGDTRRVTAIIWGNTTDDVRMDVFAGVGAMIAKIAETEKGFVLYAPREAKAYAQAGHAEALLAIGAPLPFDLGKLAALLTGRYAAVFGKTYESASAAEGAIAYVLENSLGGILQVAPGGRPMGWASDDWRLAITYGDENVPERLRLENSEGKIAVLLVKERSIPENPFDSAQMELVLPAGIPVLPLANYKAP